MPVFQFDQVDWTSYFKILDDANAAFSIKTKSSSFIVGPETSTLTTKTSAPKVRFMVLTQRCTINHAQLCDIARLSIQEGDEKEAGLEGFKLIEILKNSRDDIAPTEDQLEEVS